MIYHFSTFTMDFMWCWSLPVPPTYTLTCELQFHEHQIISLSCQIQVSATVKLTTRKKNSIKQALMIRFSITCLAMYHSVL